MTATGITKSSPSSTGQSKTSKSPRQILEEGRALLSKPENWTQRVAARDIHGIRVGSTEEYACSWCSYGALNKVDPDHGWQRSDAEEHLEQAAKELQPGCVSYVHFNDSHTHSEVLQMWDKAIQNAES